MTGIYLHDMAYALGDRVASVEASATQGRTLSPTAALRDAGFARHHICDPATTGFDLAERCVAQIGDRLAGTDAIVYATCLTPNGNLGCDTAFKSTGDVKHLMDFPASRLQDAFALDGAAVIGLNQQACTSALGAIRIARGLLTAEPDLGQVLCVTADRFPEGARYEQAYNLISDGAACYLVSRRAAGFRVLGCHQITNGALAQANDDETVGSYFTYTDRLIRQALDKTGLGLDDIDWIVPQNMNAKAWRVLAGLLGVPIDRVFDEPLPETAHVISADNIINLKRLSATGRLHPGDRILLVMAGYGMNWQSVILEAV